MEADHNGFGGLLYNGIDVGALLSLLREKIFRVFTSNMTKNFAENRSPPTYSPPSTVRAAVFWDDESGGLFVELVGDTDSAGLRNEWMLGQAGRRPCRDSLETADMQRLFEMI